MAPQSGLVHAEKDDTQRNRQALLAGLLAGAVGVVAYLAYRRHHRSRTSKAAPRGGGRGEGKPTHPAPPGHKTGAAGDGGNGSAVNDAATPGRDGASEEALTEQKAGTTSGQRSVAASCSAEVSAGADSASQDTMNDAATPHGGPCVSGTCASLNGPTSLAAATQPDASASGLQPDTAHAVNTTPAPQPRHSRSQGQGSDTALTAVPGSRQVIPAASRGGGVACNSNRSKTPGKLAPGSKGDAQAARAGAVPVWTQPDGQSQSAASGQKRTVPASTALVCSTPASKAVIVHQPPAEAGASQPQKQQQQQQQQQSMNGDIMKGCSITPNAAASVPPSANGKTGAATGDVAEQLDCSSLEVGTDSSAASQAGGGPAGGDNGSQADGQAEERAGLPYTWSQDHDDIFLAVPVADGVAAGEVSVDFHARSLRVTVSGEVIVDGGLPKPVHPEDCTWQFEEVAGERRLSLTLVKARPELWWSAIKGHPELDQAALKAVAALYVGDDGGAPGRSLLTAEE